MDRFDYTDGDFCMDMGGGMMMDTQGHMMQDMGGGMAMALSGEMQAYCDIEDEMVKGMFGTIVQGYLKKGYNLRRR